MSRDTDQIFIDREVSAVNEWLQSDLQIHIIRDHWGHYVPILGGLWGVKNPTQFKQTFETILFSKWKVGYGQDQLNLKKNLIGNHHSTILIHDAYHCMDDFGNATWKPFPTRRKFVNSRWEGYIAMSERQNNKDHDIRKCPIECRPQDHLDWEFC